MNITKYQHACLVVEKGGQRVVVDPGIWSTDFLVPEKVLAIVITHIHPDHLDAEKLKAIVATSPQAVIYAHEEVLASIEGLATQAVTAGETVSVGEFTLRFTGGEHATIHTSYPPAANLGVIIDDALYYPGDSFALPNAVVHTLALPVSAPWMKISEAMDFLVDAKPMRVFPTHDAILSETGQSLVDRMLGATAESIGARYQRLTPGQTTEL